MRPPSDRIRSRRTFRSHHADEVFTSWGMETAAVYEKSRIGDILEELDREKEYGIVLRAKGMVPATASSIFSCFMDPVRLKMTVPAYSIWLMKNWGIEIKEMNSGCICCSLVGDFGTSLQEVLKTYEPERILIEIPSFLNWKLYNKLKLRLEQYLTVCPIKNILSAM